MRNFTISTLLTGLLATVLALHAPVSEAATSKHKPVAAKSAKHVKPAKAGVKGVKAVKASAKSAKLVKGKARGKVHAKAHVEPVRPSVGQTLGLQHTSDHLALKSNVALVVDQDTNEVLLAKNPDAVLPIASLTKLMTTLVVVEARQNMDEVITITDEDIDTEKGSHSRLAVGTSLTRGEALHLALMSSENRAANALGRHFPGGLPAVVQAMNAKAKALGMSDTHYVEPTGLSSKNQSSAKDLAMLVREAYRQPLLREYSTSTEAAVEVGRRQVQFRNTNGLVYNDDWEIGLQKTGYIVEAGRYLVMQTKMAGRKLIMVFLDSAGKYTRIADAERVRRWMQQTSASIKGTVRAE
ncbi:MAG: D-alanyl-D-alanine endopeptidase [Burkholderiaceae bacterium]|nr:MAG: D-alanyl-D-alanine endopeptidase [Burkholderiaceae bacterium]